MERPPAAFVALADRGAALYVERMRLSDLRARWRRPDITVVRLFGVISATARPGEGLSDAGVAPLLEKAFARKPKAVALALNSPGGSPVQSALIGARIRALSEKHKVPVYAFCEDVAASGGYWIAAAADYIYADQSSIIGSIGVISAGFGFHEAMGRAGIERRVHTAGTDKSMLDPFRPEREEDVTRLKALQAVIHRNFIDHVTARRGDRLVAEDPGEDLFTGEIWCGAAALERGLIDGIGHLRPVLEEKFGPKLRLRVIAPKRGLLGRLRLPGMRAAFDAVEDKAVWGRFGL